MTECVRAYIRFLRSRPETMPTDALAFDVARTRKMTAAAKLAEITVARELRQLVPEAEFEEVFAGSCERLRAALRGMRSRYAPRFLGITHKTEAIQRLGEIEEDLLARIRDQFPLHPKASDDATEIAS